MLGVLVLIWWTIVRSLLLPVNIIRTCRGKDAKDLFHDAVVFAF